MKLNKINTAIEEAEHQLDIKDLIGFPEIPLNIILDFNKLE